MTKLEATKKIESYYAAEGKTVVIRDGKAYDANPNELFGDLQLSALGSGDAELYEAFRVLEADEK
jgi:hypothetical protein